MDTRANKRLFMEGLVASYQSSGLNKKTFALKEGISIPKLDYWMKKFSKQQAEISFVSLSVSSSQVNTRKVELCYPNGIKLKLPKDAILSKTHQAFTLASRWLSTLLQTPRKRDLQPTNDT
eukprot:gene750-929_t